MYIVGILREKICSTPTQSIHIGAKSIELSDNIIYRISLNKVRGH